jgi:uncharacterized protein (DUF427 family)
VTYRGGVTADAHLPREPGADHPIHIARAGRRIVVAAGDTVIADSANALCLQEAALPPVYYLPPDSVNWKMLERNVSHTYCPYKGEAGYYSVRTADGSIADAAWTYEDPYHAVAAIARYLAFYPSRVTVTMG